jgi:hypothetical protein
MTEATFPVTPGRAAYVSPVATLMATAIASAVVFVLGVAFGVRGWDVAVLGLAVLTGFVGMIPLLFDASRPPAKRQLLITAIGFVYIMFFVVPVFTQYFWAQPTTFDIWELHTHRPQDIAAAQVAALTGLICLIAGFHTPIGRSVSRALPKLTPEWSHGTVLMVALLMIPLGWSIYLGGLSGIIPRRAGTGVLGSIAMSIFFGISLLALAFIRYRSRPALVLLLLVIPPTMAFNFFTGSKRLFLTAPFMVALAYTLIERRIRVSFAVAGIVMLIVLYPVAQFHREVVQRGFSRDSSPASMRASTCWSASRPRETASMRSASYPSSFATHRTAFRIRAAGPSVTSSSRTSRGSCGRESRTRRSASG